MSAFKARSIFVGTFAVLMVAGCTADGVALLPGPDYGEDGGQDAGEDEADDTDGGEVDEGFDELLDLGGGGEARALTCQLQDELDAALPCDRPPTTTTLAPVVAWSWTGPDGEDSVLVTPLVANLDDDNLDGAIDLCDTPDVLALAVDLPSQADAPWPAGHLYLLDGELGEQSLRIQHPVDAGVTPAIADLDGDGDPEIIAVEAAAPNTPDEIVLRRLVAFDHDGALAWASDHWLPAGSGGAVAVADLDGDGSPEILAPNHIADADGNLLWQPPSPPERDSVPIAVDLDLDGELEVLFGGSAYDRLGNALFDLPGNPDKNIGTAAVANFDDDPFPEIYVQAAGHRILEHDGSLKAACPGGAGHPVAIEDLDGDGKAEILHGHNDKVHALAVAGPVCFKVWSQSIDDLDAKSSGTAFDFLADGTAESVYADRSRVRIFGDQGQVLFELERAARSSLANPVVADVDNDGAAEILVVGSEPLAGDSNVAAARAASVMMLQNADDALAPTRRVWNQHAYHGTVIGEDASVPVALLPHWLEDKGFRTNAAPASDLALCQAPIAE